MPQSRRAQQATVTRTFRTPLNKRATQLSPLRVIPRAAKGGRGRGRPLIGSAPAEVVPVRLDPELRAAVEACAAADRTTTSDVIREALRRFLDVA